VLEDLIWCVKMERLEYKWGYELILWKDNKFCVKLIHIDYGYETELHKHLYKREVIVDEKLNTFFINIGEPHILSCYKGKNFTEFIEVSTKDSIFDKIRLE